MNINTLIFFLVVAGSSIFLIFEVVKTIIDFKKGKEQELIDICSYTSPMIFGFILAPVLLTILIMIRPMIHIELDFCLQ